MVADSTNDWPKYGWFRVLDWNQDARGLTLTCYGLEDPDAEIVFCEWNKDSHGSLTFRGEVFFINYLGWLIPTLLCLPNAPQAYGLAGTISRVNFHLPSVGSPSPIRITWPRHYLDD